MGSVSFREAVPPTLLIVDDEQTIRSLCEELVVDCGLHAKTASTTEQALQILQRVKVDGILTDVRVPVIGGMDLLKRVRQNFPLVDVFVFTQYGTIETAVQAMRLGAIDYVTKPFLAEKFRQQFRDWAQDSRFGVAHGVEQFGLVGKSPKMVEVQEAIAKVARLDSTILILGESGTGKEVVARSIHRFGPRAAHPFVAVDCASLTPSLIESELFGYSKGAFTGAVERRTGLIGAASGGTLFLDEIAELSKEMQAKLLRVIQEKEIRPIGDVVPIRVNVRLIAATNRDLDKAVTDGTFREDLFYRLSVVSLEIPPLRERKDDLPLLVAAFLKKHADPLRPVVEIGQDFWETATRYHWPGNVRELENFVERCIVLGSGPTLRDEGRCLILGRTAENLMRPSELLRDVERGAILKTLKETEGDRGKAAAILGIGKSTLYRKLKSY